MSPSPTWRTVASTVPRCSCTDRTARGAGALTLRPTAGCKLRVRPRIPTAPPWTSTPGARSSTRRWTACDRRLDTREAGTAARSRHLRRTARQPRRLPAPKLLPWDMAYSPDGTRLAVAFDQYAARFRPTVDRSFVAVWDLAMPGEPIAYRRRQRGSGERGRDRRNRCADHGRRDRRHGAACAGTHRAGDRCRVLA